MNPPNLEEGKYSVMSSEYSTGVVLDIDGTRYFEGSNKDVFWVFDSLRDAERFIAEDLSINPDKEYSLYDFKASFVYVDCIGGRRS